MAFTDSNLKFGGSIESLSQETNFRQLLDELYQTNWVVYCKPPPGEDIDREGKQNRFKALVVKELGRLWDVV